MHGTGGLSMTEEVIKLVNALREDAEWAHANEWETPITLGDNLDTAADLIESMSAQLDQVTRERDAAKDINVPTQPKWISVKERLPEPFVSVLVHIPEEEPLPQVHEGFITPDGTWCSVLYVETCDRVAH